MGVPSYIEVSSVDFETFLKAYPRPLKARPPLDRPANFRAWIDPTLSPWPDNQVAKMTRHHKSVRFEILRDPP